MAERRGTSPLLFDLALQGLKAWLRGLGEIRDGILVAVAILYGLGYLARALDPINSKFPVPLDLLDAQYLGAGALPALILLMAGAVARYGASRPPRLVTHRVLVVRALVPMALLVLLLVAANDTSLGLLDLLLDLPYSSPIVFVLYWASQLYAIGRPVILGGRQGTPIPTAAIMNTVAIFLFGMLLYYILVVPQLPEALGGMSWRTARLDLVRNQLSVATAQLLIPHGTPLTPVVRSELLQIANTRGDMLIVYVGQPDGSRRWSLREVYVLRKDGRAEARRLPVVALRRDAVAGIVWER
jgi:hypothetical protein